MCQWSANSIYHVIHKPIVYKHRYTLDKGGPESAPQVPRRKYARNPYHLITHALERLFLRVIAGENDPRDNTL